MAHLIVGHGVSGCLGTRLAPMRSLKRGQSRKGRDLKPRCLRDGHRPFQGEEYVTSITERKRNCTKGLFMPWKIKELQSQVPLVALHCIGFSIVFVAVIS
jgi:hypothetical protein